MTSRFSAEPLRDRHDRFFGKSVRRAHQPHEEPCTATPGGALTNSAVSLPSAEFGSGASKLRSSRLAASGSSSDDVLLSLFESM